MIDKILTVALVTSLGLGIWTKFKLFQAEADIAHQELTIQELTTERDLNKQALEEEKTVVNKLVELTADNAERVTELTNVIFESNLKTDLINAEINRLRTKEQDLARQAPFERGNAAGIRRNNSIMRIIQAGSD